MNAKHLSGFLSLLLATMALPALAVPADAEDKDTLGEVIVTAQKKSERLQDVPIPITSVSADTLVESHQVRLQDFYTRFPGMDVAVTAQSHLALLVRGLGAAITIDDVPISITSFLEQAGGLGLDLDPSGLSQIELLRGPQGTLYGANSQGGLLRYVTTDPRTDAVSGRWDVGISSTKNGNEPGLSFRGSANLPVSDTVAFSIDGFGRQEAGYIDNPTLGREGVNEAHTYGGHVAMLWQPSDEWSVKLGAFVQQAKGDGTNDVNVGPGLGPYDQHYIAGAGNYKRISQLYDATVKYKADAFELTSVTGFIWTGFHDAFDGTSSGLAPFGQFGIPGTDFHGFGQPGMLVPESAHSRSFSQEIRLATKIGESVDVLVGAFYNYARGEFDEDLDSSNPLTGEIAGRLVFVGFASAARSYAAFTNLTFHVNDQFSVQVGGRQEYDYTYSDGTTFAGPGNPIFGIPTAEPTTLPAPDGKSNKFTYLITPQYKISPDMMVYARVASGYSPGQANPATADIPSTSKPDTVIDYELGMKAELVDNRWSVDAAVYRIKHDDIQQGLFSDEAQIFYTGNAGNAVSEGVELTTEVRPATGLRVSGWVARNRSKLSGLPPDSALASYEGQSLPFSPKWSGNVSVDQQFPISGSAEGFAGVAFTYMGERHDGLVGGGENRLRFPSYTRTDLNAGINYGDWTGRLYANNVTNRRGLLNGGPSSLIPDSFYYIMPRTIGLLVSKKF